ncbi:unnamed protein product [Spirodela intermedia]|uniref:Phytocyanin domain-containing protein n=1 Tax=Spirodela intermedia TaxID=51605 RepID=A0A7I8KPR2_SPIIN|nr:unnamed protein product [Spirodela intermedia]
MAAAAGMATPSAAALYKVGDSAGWTATGNVNYSAWASSKTFHVGDIIVFEYNAEVDNVLEVTREAYHNCSVLSPIAAHATGSDAFLLRRTGHRFFLSGAAGHCTIGQKVNIRVPKLPRATAPARPPSHASSSSTPNRATHTKENAAAVPQGTGGAARRSLGWTVALASLAIGGAAVASLN